MSQGIEPYEVIARQRAQRLMAEGARAVVLAGSHLRGEAALESDIDLYAFGDRDGYWLEREGGALLSITWRSPEAERDAFTRPNKVGAVIPAWRKARILADPDGIASALQAASQEWTWDDVGDERIAAYVANEITGLAEEIHKLINALRGGARWTAAVQRSIIALHLAPVMAVHLRLLYESENRLWDEAAEMMGEDWSRAQDESFTGAFGQSCEAALQLYRLAAAAAEGFFSPEQREVVRYAAALRP